MRISVHLLLTGVSLLLAACTAAGGGTPTGTAAPSEAASVQPSGSSASSATAAPASSASAAPAAAVSPVPSLPSASPAQEAPWLRAWITQALPPQNMFSLSDALVVTTAGVAVQSTPVPAVFPGPAVMPLGGRQLTAAGRTKIIDLARALGLFDGKSDFGSGSMPGAPTGHILLTVDGKAVEITGNPNSTMECAAAPCNPASGSPEAFGRFWQDLASLDWLGADAAAQQPYDPPVYSVLIGPPPTPDANLGVPTAVWPLAVALTSFGRPVLNGSLRCGTVTGTDATTLRLTLARANGLTQWVQSATTNATFGLTVRPLTDGQDACREVFGVG